MVPLEAPFRGVHSTVRRHGIAIHAVSLGGFVMKSKKVVFLGVTLTLLVGSVSYAALSNMKEPVAFYKGHTHESGETVGAPSHSGGTDAYGCHNGSVPYHCH